METKRSLLDDILSDANLNYAAKQVMANKGSAGIDRMPVSKLPDFIEKNGTEMKEKIRRRKYRPLPVRRVKIPKDGGGERDLGVPAVKDRWIEQATYQVLSPIFERTFSETSYGFRPGRKAEQAIVRSLEYMNDGYDWIVDMDLSKFFDNVNQDILMILVHKVIKDPDVESLVRRFLQSGVMVNGTFQETKVGTAQGSPISPLLANIYLNEFDKELEARGLRFTRYADDCIICVKSEKAANRVMESVTRWLDKHLRVQVNTTKTKVTKPNDMKYLGFAFYRSNGKWYPKPHEKSVQKLMHKLVPLLRRNWGVSLAYRIERINAVTRGWINYFRIGNMRSKLEKIDPYIRKHLRMIIWKQWKTVRKRYESLRKLGKSKEEAWAWANSRKGILVNGLALNYVIQNKMLEAKGFVPMVKHFDKVHNAQHVQVQLLVF